MAREPKLDLNLELEVLSEIKSVFEDVRMTCVGE